MNDARHSLSTRPLMASLVVLVGLVLLVQLTSGEAGAAKGKAKVAVSVVTKKQSSLLKKGKLKVKLDANRKRKVKLSAAHDGRASSSRRTRSSSARRQERQPEADEEGARRSSRAAAPSRSACTPSTGRRGKSARRATRACSSRTRRAATRPYRPVPVENADRCDFLDPAVCLQPFPNDYFTVDDATTATGKRLNLNLESMPANIGGVHIDPTDMNRADGFSPGNAIIVKIPEVETPARSRTPASSRSTTCAPTTTPSRRSS